MTRETEEPKWWKTGEIQARVDGRATLHPSTLHLLWESTLHPPKTTWRPPSLHPPPRNLWRRIRVSLRCLPGKFCKYSKVYSVFCWYHFCYRTQNIPVVISRQKNSHCYPKTKWRFKKSTQWKFLILWAPRLRCVIILEVTENQTGIQKCKSLSMIKQLDNQEAMKSLRLKLRKTLVVHSGTRWKVMTNTPTRNRHSLLPWRCIRVSYIFCRNI